MVKISIIVPVYNAEKYLDICLESLVNQSLQDIEIICVNDGSTDGSLEILKRYENCDKRVKVIDKQNEGQSVARNLAIRLAQGEFLGFVDADDWVDEDYYEKMYAAVQDCGAEIACAGFYRVKGKRYSRRKSFIVRKLYTEIQSKLEAVSLPRDNYFWNKIFKRQSFIDTGIIFPEGKLFEDLAILIKVLYFMGGVVTVPHTYYYYRKHPGSTVELTTAAAREDYKAARNELFDFADEHNIQLNEFYLTDKKEYIRFLNLTICKVYYCRNKIQYKLFGFIPIMEKLIV